MSINMLLQNLSASNCGSAPSVKAANKKSGGQKKDKTDNFLALFSQLLSVKPETAPMAKLTKGKNAAGARAKELSGQLFLKLKALASRMLKNPGMSRAEKRSLVSRLKIKQDVEELLKLSPAERSQSLNWLKGLISLNAGASGRETDGREPVLREIGEMLKAQPGLGFKTLTTETPGLADSEAQIEEVPSGRGRWGKPAVAQAQAGLAGKKNLTPVVGGNSGAGDASSLKESGVNEKALLQFMSTLLEMDQGSAKKGVGKLSIAKPDAKQAKLKIGRLPEAGAENKGPGTDDSAGKPPTLEALIVQKTKSKIPLKQNQPLIKFKEPSQAETRLNVLSGAKEEVKTTSKSDSTMKNLNPDANQMEINQKTSPVKTAKTTVSQRLASDPYQLLEQVTHKIRLEIRPGVSRVEMQLEPKHLGKVQVELTLENNHLSAKMTTENVMTQDVLKQNVAQLKTALQAQGIQVDSLNISFGGEGNRQFAFQHDGQKPSGKNGKLNKTGFSDELTIGSRFLNDQRQVISSSRVDYLI